MRVRCIDKKCQYEFNIYSGHYPILGGDSTASSNSVIRCPICGTLDPEQVIMDFTQQSLSGSDDKSSSAQICDDFEDGEKCTKGLNATCGKCGYLSDADF